MAEGRYDYENRELDKEDYYDDDSDINDKLPMVLGDGIQWIALNQSNHIADLRGQLSKVRNKGV